MPKINDIARWRTEVELSEKFRDEEFGKYTSKEITKAGENIEYYEKGWSQGYFNADDDTTMTLNLFHSVVKNVVPALWFKRPRITATPNRRQDADAAFFARHIINHFYKSIKADENNRLAIWDAYVLQKAVTKIGYATKFGVDIPDPDEQKKKKTNLVDRTLESIGLKEREEKEEDIFPEIDLDIVAEWPYIQWISPFKYLRDPRSTCLDDALWCAHVVDKTVSEVKANKMFRNTSRLEGTDPDIPTERAHKVPMTAIEEFRIVQLYEIHYRQPEGFYLLYITKDGSEFRTHYHEKSVYKLNDWQFDEIDFSGHRHKPFKKSELDKIKTLQDRFTSTTDAIMEQVDRFVPKIMVDQTKVDDQAKRTLEEGDIGSIVYVNSNPQEVAREISFTQFKADLKAINDEIINLISIQTGITKAQLLGVASGETATAETIAQGGQTLRFADMSTEIQRVANSQANKVWSIITQFVTLEDLEIITGESGVDPETGKPIFTWLDPITPDIGDMIRRSDLRFEIEVGSTQKLDNNLIRKHIENFSNFLVTSGAVQLTQQQGKKVDVSELIRMWLRTLPEVFPDTSRIIQDVGQGTQGLLSQDQVDAGLGVSSNQGGTTRGSNINQLRAQSSQPAPSAPQQLSEAGQI